MEIVSKGREIQFRKLHAGDCFKYGIELFIRIKSEPVEHSYNAVCLRTGAVCTFGESDMVEKKPNARVVV